jgi:hypothetical protein
MVYENGTSAAAVKGIARSRLSHRQQRESDGGNAGWCTLKPLAQQTLQVDCSRKKSFAK